MEGPHPEEVREAVSRLPGEIPFVLASGSAIRKRILDDAGLAYEAVPAPMDEPRPRSGEVAEHYVLRAAEAKALAVSTLRPGKLVVGCDQVVAFDGKILTKVETQDAACERLQILSGNEHFLVNGMVLVGPDGGIMRHLEVVQLTMRTLDERTIRDYVERENPLSSVACYFLEGRGLQLIEDMQGSFHSALGLPVLSLMSLLERMDPVR